MSFFEKAGDALANWNKEEFRKLFHEDFLFIRETELVTLDDHMDKMNEFMSNQDNAKMMAARRIQGLVHENRFVTEIRWEENDEIFTNVF